MLMGGKRGMSGHDSRASQLVTSVTPRAAMIVLVSGVVFFYHAVQRRCYVFAVQN